MNEFFFKKKQICITGASGFIGRKLIDQLLRSNYRLRVLTRDSSTLFPIGVDVIIGDLKDRHTLVSFVRDCDILYHCAAEINDERLMKSVHINGTKNLLEAINNQRPYKKVHWIQLSSVGVYGPPINWAGEERVLTEDSPSRPVNLYELTKEHSDRLIISAQQSDLITYTIIRPSSVISDGAQNKSIKRLVKFARSRYFFYVGKPGSVANYVHVDDVIGALHIAGTNQNAVNQIYNLSNDCSTESLMEMVRIKLRMNPQAKRFPILMIAFPLFIARFLLKKLIYIPSIVLLINRTSYPSTKIKKELNFNFKMSIQDSILESVDSLSSELNL